MMKADAITKDYVKDAGIFADIFNYFVFSKRKKDYKKFIKVLLH